MKSNIYILLFIFCLISSTTYSQQMGCNGDRFFNTVFEEVTVTSNIQYGQNTTIGGNTIDLLMDIYEPTGDQLEKRPVIVFAHGGGFVGGNKGDMAFICEDFAQRGFVTASISYRLIDALVTDSIGAANAVVKAIGDMRAAIRFIREDAANANLFRADSDFIFAGGISAGAVMSNGVGYVDTLDNIPPYLWDIINANGGPEGNSSSNTQYSSAVQGVLNYSGSIGSSLYIDSDDPPLYSFHNEFDEVVPCNYASSSAFPFPNFTTGSCEMHTQAEAVGIKNKFHFYSESDGHVLWPYTYVRHETAQFLGEILCETSSPPTAWEETGSGFESPGFAIFDISAVDENVVWTVSTPPRFDVGAQKFSRTTDGGQTWETGTIPVNDPSFSVIGIHALDENIAWATLLSFPDEKSGGIYKTTDGGLTWTHQSTAFTGANEGSHGIHFFDENNGFAFAYVNNDDPTPDTHVGYVTSNGGTLWEKLSSAVYPAVSGERLSIFNPDFLEAKGDRLWFGTDDGKVYRSEDQGKTWETRLIEPDRSIHSLAFKNELSGIAVSRENSVTGVDNHKAYKTFDGGKTWSEISIPESPRPVSIHYVEGSASEPSNCGTYIMYYYSSFVGGPGSAYSNDDGQTWTFISEQPAYTVEFVNPELGWLGGITHSPNGGLFKWTGDPLFGNGNCLTSTKEKIVDNSNLLIYPNPAADFLNIELENDWQGELTLRLVNALGQEVFSESFSKNIYEWKGQVELSELPSGMYQILISDGDRMMVQSLIRN